MKEYNSMLSDNFFLQVNSRLAFFPHCYDKLPMNFCLIIFNLLKVTNEIESMQKLSLSSTAQESLRKTMEAVVAMHAVIDEEITSFPVSIQNFPSRIFITST